MRFDKSIGIKEIARKAGVSSTTVSRVLRNKGEISAETRHRVEKIAEDLGYRPNLAVRTMQTGRSGIVGILMDITHDPGYRGKVLFGIHDTLIAADYLPMVIWARPETLRCSEIDQVHRLVDHRVDGIIMSSDDLSESFYQYIDRLSIPVVIIDRLIDEVHRDIVITDNDVGGKLAADHLIGLGHRKICYISDHGTAAAEDGGRAAPFIAEISKVRGARCSLVQARQVHGGYGESMEILRKRSRPTAIFAFNDYIAYQVYRAAMTLGIRVPEELSILGFGNLSNIVEVFPTLTTFEQEPERLGIIAAKRMIGRITEEVGEPPEIIKLEPTFVRRSSTAPVGG